MIYSGGWCHLSVMDTLFVNWSFMEILSINNFYTKQNRTDCVGSNFSFFSLQILQDYSSYDLMRPMPGLTNDEHRSVILEGPLRLLEKQGKVKISACIYHFLCYYVIQMFYAFRWFSFSISIISQFGINFSCTGRKTVQSFQNCPE